jgi:hypothetical protein
MPNKDVIKIAVQMTIVHYIFIFLRQRFFNWLLFDRFKLRHFKISFIFFRSFRSCFKDSHYCDVLFLLFRFHSSFFSLSHHVILLFFAFLSCNGRASFH